MYTLTYTNFLGLILLVTALSVSSCTNSEAVSSCDLVGTWEVETVEVISCDNSIPDFSFEALQNICTTLPQGEICRKSNWTFNEDNTIDIDLTLIFSYDDDRESVIETLRWTYSHTPEGALEICPAQIDFCGVASCSITEGELTIGIMIRDCMVSFTYIPAS